MNPTRSKKPNAIAMVLLAIGICGISYWHYQDMVKPIPEFESLKHIPADGMKYEIARPRGVSSQASFEFTDQSGNRFQTDYMEADEASAIKDALERGGVILSVGRWKHAIESNSIFTVYHMTRGENVLIDYRRIAEGKKNEQQRAVLVVVISLVVTVGIIAFVSWKQYKRAEYTNYR
jgi:hypothetical protein